MFRPLLLLCLLCTCARAQELPPILRHAPEDHGGGSQTWSLTQDDNGFIYAANNEGLLEYDGHRWTRYASPDRSIVRSVFATQDRVYTGSYMDFGVWERTPDGRLAYRSLAENMRAQVRPDEQFWRILPWGEVILFQSLQQFFLYDPVNDELSVLPPQAGILRTLPTRRRLFFQNTENTLYELAAGRIVPVPGGERLPRQLVQLRERDGGLVAQSAQAGQFRITPEGLREPVQSDFLRGRRIYSAIPLRDGGAAYGTVSAGLFVTDRAGRLRFHVDQSTGLTNNTVLSLFEDAAGNLWVGTDNGISTVNLLSPLRKFTDPTGRIGAVYAAAVNDGLLYVGSNQGLFARPAGDHAAPFALIPGTRGQVWGLHVYDGVLFVGHDAGTFLVRGRRSEGIEGSSGLGTWLFARPAGREDLLIQGTYRGLDVLERRGGTWRVRNHLTGFDYSARFLAQPGPGRWLVSHEYRGVYGLRLNDDLTAVEEVTEYTTPAKGKHASLTTFEGSAFYLSRQGLFTLDRLGEEWRRDSLLNAGLLPADYTSGRLTATADRLWFFDRRSLSNLHRGALDGELRRQTIPLAADLINAKSGFENIAPVGADTFLIGTADGYLRLALDAVPLPRHEIYLTAVESGGREDTTALLPFASPEDVSVDFTANNLRFAYAVPHYDKYFRPYFQYRLLGLTEEWSEWSEQPGVTFSDLPHGDYRLEVRSLLGRRGGENVLAYAFTVRRPWYASYPAYLAYLLLAAALVYLLHFLYTRHYRRQAAAYQRETERQAAEQARENARRIAEQEHQNELELSRLRNEQLRQEMDGRAREAATRTRNLVRKNEILLRIKTDLLKRGKDPADVIRHVVNTIDEHLDEGESWDLFREAFEQTDRAFFSRLRDLHPDLTANDLKLCAYLRLNLSTKEIAPLLNISARSVEVKRYRLRKKLGLEREVGLTDYIIAIE